MARAKVDGVIEAVRYTSGGKIDLVRVYQRHGVVWSDRLLLERKDLIEQLKKKKRYVIGERKVYLGSRFETGPAVRCVEDHIITDGQPSTRDQLAGVGVF